MTAIPGVTEKPPPGRWWQLLVGPLLTLPFVFVLLANDYLPGTDESYQLEAAVRLAGGQGYTAGWCWATGCSPRPGAQLAEDQGMNAPAKKDLSTPVFTRVVAWPIGYSLLVAGFVKMGIPFGTAAKFLKLVALMGSIFAWYHFASRVVTNLAARLVFCAFMSFFSVVCAESATDLMLLGLFAAISHLVLTVPASPGPATFGARWPAKVLLLSGLLTGISIALKYSALPFAVLVGGWLLMSSRGDMRAALRDSTLFAFPPAVIVGAIFLSNFFSAGSISTYTEGGLAGSTLGWRAVWMIDSLRAAFFDAFYLPRVGVREVLARIAPQFERTASAAMLVFILAAVGWSVVVLFRRGGTDRNLACWLIGAYLSALAFLGLTASLYFHNNDWTPLEHGRFYEWFVPVTALCVLKAVFPSAARTESAPSLTSRAILPLVISAFFVAALSGYSVHMFRVTRVITSDAQAAYEKLASIVSDTNSPVVVAFVDSNNFRMFPWKGVSNAYSDPVSFSSGSRFTRQTVVAMVCARSGAWERYRGADSCAQGGFDAAAGKYGFSKVEAGEHNTLYWKVYLPGPAPVH